MKQKGRPSKYTKVLAEKICKELARGQTMRRICESDDMPNPDTVYTWILKHKDFSEQYSRARAIQAEMIFDEILDIADKTSQDTITDENGYEKPNSEWITRSKLRVDTRKWMLAKIMPKKYGDKLEVDQKTEHSGKVETEVVVNFIGK